MAASNEDRERQAILEEAVEATEHDLEKFRNTAEEELLEEQVDEDRMYNTMFLDKRSFEHCIVHSILINLLF